MKIEIRFCKHGGVVYINGRPRYDITEINFDGVDHVNLSTTDKFKHIFKHADFDFDSMTYTFRNISKKHVNIKNGALKFL